VNDAMFRMAIACTECDKCASSHVRFTGSPRLWIQLLYYD